jgi:glucosamine--fructose-6-phosphate aminotransferase (isomerizing)
MAGEPQDPPESSRSSTSQSSPAMLREIYEQPRSLRETIRRNVEGSNIFPAAIRSIDSAFSGARKIIIAASGSSRNAGLAGEIMMEDLAGVAVDVEYSSEYCLRSSHAGADSIVVVITQSGETADTIAAQREALRRGAKTVAISNVADSMIAREASARLITYAAPECAVPATKSFTAQLAILYLFALFLAHERGRIRSEDVHNYLGRLAEVPNEIERQLSSWDSQVAKVASFVQDAKAFLYLGRGIHYAIAREGALKLKEVSYVQAEGMPAGELRHGPNALVDEKLVVLALATRNASDDDSTLRYQKTLGVLKYVKGCGGRVIAIATEGDGEVLQVADQVIFVPASLELLLPILEVVPLQLFAYYFATINGCDVDHPRHLVKAVVRE